MGQRAGVQLSEHAGYKNAKVSEREDKAAKEFMDALREGKIKLDLEAVAQQREDVRLKIGVPGFAFNPRIPTNLPTAYEILRDGQWLPKSHRFDDVWMWGEKKGLKDYAEKAIKLLPR